MNKIIKIKIKIENELFEIQNRLTIIRTHHRKDTK
jgi:hypothetical protein